MLDELKRNGSGYVDPTASMAIINADAQEADDRFHKLLHAIFDMCELAGFRLDGRIVLVDKNNGKVWR